MIVEVLGTGGAGKTTLEPLLATGLGIDHFPAGKRTNLDGVRLNPTRVWVTRLVAVLASPGLFLAAFRGIPGSLRKRLWFATDLCRRERNARNAAARGEGVLASGTLHALAQGSARFGTDLSGLATKIRPADLYVRLDLDPLTAAQRLAGRRQVEMERIGDHVEWTKRYEKVLDAALARLGARVISVPATGEPGEIAAKVVAEVPPAQTR